MTGMTGVMRTIRHTPSTSCASPPLPRRKDAPASELARSARMDRADRAQRRACSASASRSTPTRSLPPSPTWRRAPRRRSALLFENIAGDRSGSRVLANMLGSSKERYALAVGLDPDLSIAEMIAESRTIMNRRIAPVRIPKSKAPVNEVVLHGDDIDLTAVPGAEILAGRRRPLHRHRRHHADRLARHRPHQRRLLPADAARAAPRRALLLARQARRGSTARRGGNRASPARWSPPTASIRCCSCWRRRCSAPRNPSSTSPAA